MKNNMIIFHRIAVTKPNSLFSRLIILKRMKNLENKKSDVKIMIMSN